MYRTHSFEQAANAVSQKLADLLSAAVTVVDERGIVRARSLHAGTSPRDPINAAPHADDLHIPLNLSGQIGTVIVGAPPSSAPISPHLARGLVELVVNDVCARDQGRTPHEHKQIFIHDLLNGLLTDEPTILREARVLGLDFTPPRAVILINATDYIGGAAAGERVQAGDATTRQRAQQVIGQVSAFFHLPNETICAHIGNGEVVVLKASDTRNLVNWVDRQLPVSHRHSAWANLGALRRASEALLARLHSTLHPAITIGVGRYHPGIVELARSYQDARAALTLGCRFHGSEHIHSLDRLGIAAFIGLSDERTKIELATYLLSPLDHDPDLIKTLTTFFDSHCSPSVTARALAIHRNTLNYRLAKVAALVGLDPCAFNDAVQIRLALIMRSWDTTQN